MFRAIKGATIGKVTGENANRDEVVGGDDTEGTGILLDL